MSASTLAADGTSARAKAKAQHLPDPLARKPQFRTVLDNPLQLNWYAKHNPHTSATRAPSG